MTSDALALKLGSYVSLLDASDPSTDRTATVKLKSARAVGSSITLGEASAELLKTAIEASVPNWDGHGAVPVKLAALAHAEAFLEAFPTSLPQPEVSADPDGEVSFDWFFRPDVVFSLSISETGRLSYAGLFGHASTYGEESLSDRIPGTILAGLHRCMAVDLGDRTAG